MPDMTRKLILPVLALLASVASSPMLAQEDRWFRVELLVFANESSEAPAGAAIAEQWDATPTLAYPLASRFLIDTTRVAENAAKFDGDSVVDEYGRQIITMLSTGAATNTADNSDSGPAVPRQTSEAATTTPTAPVPPSPVYQGGQPPGAAATGLEPAPAPAPGKPLTLPRPFVLLPGEHLELGAKAAQMQRGGRYTVLFHETWVQPVPPEERSLPIVLDHSGDTGQWSRLQGTIKLSLSRYLHVQTNLWLNTSGDYLPGTWQMPAPPLGPSSLIIEEQEPVDITTAIEQLSEPTVPGIEGEDSVESGHGSSEVAAAPIYPYRHAVLLEQTRRMRSNEAHYIDHPLLGVVIKFTPITAAELSAIAAQQKPVAGEDNQLR
tara:strand:+ start:31774 stop:32910 length:1137 start_codon:yes stop_codon:yes gene_type:complete